MACQCSFSSTSVKGFKKNRRIGQERKIHVDLLIQKDEGYRKTGCSACAEPSYLLKTIVEVDLFTEPTV